MNNACDREVQYPKRRKIIEFHPGPKGRFYDFPPCFVSLKNSKPKTCRLTGGLKTQNGEKS